MERRLGRGLGSLLPEPQAAGAAEQVDLDRIRPNPHQPRREFQEDALEELRDSIRNHGVLQPVVLRPAGDAYELISGERRCRAARMAGLRTIPAVVRSEVSEDEMLELALVENVQRADLNPLERARGFRQLMDSLGMTQEQVSARVGLKRSTVANHLRLLDLPPGVQESVGRGGISMGHARSLLTLPSDEDRARLAREIERQDLSVREVEQMVRRVSQPLARKELQPTPPPTTERPPAWQGELEKRLRTALGTRVRIKDGPDHRGQIILDYFNKEELDRLTEHLAPRPTL